MVAAVLAGVARASSAAVVSQVPRTSGSTAAVATLADIIASTGSRTNTIVRTAERIAAIQAATRLDVRSVMAVILSTLKTDLGPWAGGWVFTGTFVAFWQSNQGV